MARGRAVFLLVVGVLASCADPAPELPPPATCETPGSRAEAASGPDRKLLGLAAAYPADGALAARMDEILASQRARRAAAWEVVARVFAPIELTEPTPVTGATVPRFRAWYDKEDVRRIFSRVYEGLGADGRAAHAPLPDGLLDEAFVWNVDAIDALAAWTPEAWAERVASYTDAESVHAIGGVVRIAMSPDATRHVMASYDEVLRCVADGATPAFVDAPAEATARLAREPLDLARCATRRVGPYFVARGGVISATVDADDAENAGIAEAATITIREIVEGGDPIDRCSGDGLGGCSVDGPGIFYVNVTSGPNGVFGAVDVTYTGAMVSPACLAGRFPLASATVAAEWRRLDADFPLPIYDTSADAIAARLEAAEATWGDGDGQRMPTPTEIYTQRLPGGETFGLAGLHIRTRELDDWMNITLWYSPDPDTDFGADRPASVRALGAPWSSYKMCVSISFDEHDPDPTGGFADDAPTLAAALAAVREEGTDAAWCSNPYIDAGPGLVRGNCVGCHQHAMTGVRPAEISTDEARFPDHGRRQMRNNFPADQLWNLDAGDDLAAELATVVDYWAAAP